MGAEMDHHPETELNAQFRQQRVTGMPSTVGSSDFGAECQSRRRSLSTLSLSSSVVSSAPSGSGSEAAQSSADERRLSLRDFLLGDREASINWESEDDDSTTLNDEGEDEDQAGQDIDASLTVNNIDSSRTLFRGNLFWHLLLGYYFVYTNISILPLGTRLHVATANVAVVTLGPELLWLMRTAHRARTFGLLHIAVKLYTALNCRKVAAVLGLLSIVSSQVARRAPSRSPASILQSLAGSQVTSSTLRVDSMATFTPITLFASAALITSRILPIILVPISSIAISASFCAACALYPNLYHPTTLLSTSLIALLLGLRVEMVAPLSTAAPVPLVAPGSRPQTPDLSDPRTRLTHMQQVCGIYTVDPGSKVRRKQRDCSPNERAVCIDRIIQHPVAHPTDDHTSFFMEWYLQGSKLNQSVCNVAYRKRGTLSMDKFDL
ncbi:SubName: Full=Uncharacterized protein {ECO:0000313/EMBL:CCA75573.1} [Serendipita indica DSM 11827]|nr:SubName: Full=Uncharacterized protein {ECO:0000313/EMBL:CCA75573.1} [Serendipita indica DSM 11827]